jgi:hypothetical protein
MTFFLVPGKRSFLPRHSQKDKTMKALVTLIKIPIKIPIIAIACMMGLISVAIAADATTAATTTTTTTSTLNDAITYLTAAGSIGWLIGFIRVFIPSGESGTVWGVVTKLLDLIASNYGNAKNAS